MRHAVLLLSLSAGCGPGEEDLLVELDDEDLSRLCEDLGAARTYRCEKDGVSIEFTLGEDCEAAYAALPTGCPATVEDARLCEEQRRASYDEDPCRTDSPESCWLVDDCMLDVG
jgi:hypothetical protein